MIKRNSFVISMAAIFLAVSILLYFIHYLIFHDTHHIFIYMIGDLAFLPLEAFIVVMVIERILTRNEKLEKLQKLNMVVGAFYSELGNRLLTDLIMAFDNCSEVSRSLNITPKWTHGDFRKAVEFARKCKFKVDVRKVDLQGLKTLLAGKREFLMATLANSGLLENDRFTDVLWAVTHVDEELEARSSLADLPPSDLEHIAGDIVRMYSNLTNEWLEYVEHLQSKYPYLYSLMARMHPFQENPSAIVH